MPYYPDNKKINDHEKFGLVASLCVHACIFAGAILFANRGSELTDTPIYSVTMEGGKTIGGRMQVAKDDKKSPITPPKNVAEEQKKQEKQEEAKKEPIKEEVKVKEQPVDKDAVPIEKSTPQPQPTLKKEELKKEEAEKKEDQKKTEKVDAKKDEKKIEPKKEPPVDLNKEYQKAMQRYLGDSTEANGNGFGAAKLGGNAMGGGVVKPREFFLYLEKLKNALKGHWTWFEKSNLFIATVEIEISPDGTVLSSKIKKSSGNSLFDDSVLRAVKDASPVPPPPAIVYNDFKIVDIVFDPRE